ncbi:MAG: diguanylate cyclase [Deltaproteobacteria bacterium]|jgi:two-component system cell cycle response regulator|nr:diguanylate cyclase [Deltaproteobacteria bacterium]
MIYSILVVDDDEAIKNSVEEFLIIRNYKVKTAANAQQALDILKIFSADIVITDITMQGMDGLELTKKIKSKYHADVMVMTGYSAEYSYEEAVKAGASDFVFKPFKFEELELRISRVLRESEIKQERVNLLKKLEKLAITDALTKLYNSRHFFSEIKTEIMRNKRYSRDLSLLILDIDFFKKYNDNWGHVEGDRVLMEIGKTIKSCMRSMDTAYRYGGEEFAIILPETGIEEACVVGTRIKENISDLIFEPEPGEKKSIKISVGATEIVDGEDYKTFIKRADKALYKSKDTGRDKLSHL